MSKIFVAALLVACALPAFAASGSKADPGYPKPLLTDAENQRRMLCGFDAKVPEAECSRLRRLAAEQTMQRLDYERAHWTPADRARAERASRFLSEGADEFDKLSASDAGAETGRECGRRVEEEILRQGEAQKAAMTPAQLDAYKKTLAQYFDGDGAVELKDLKAQGSK